MHPGAGRQRGEGAYSRRAHHVIERFGWKPRGHGVRATVGLGPRDDVHIGETARIDRGVRATNNRVTQAGGRASQAPRRPTRVACSTASLREETPSLR